MPTALFEIDLALQMDTIYNTQLLRFGYSRNMWKYYKNETDTDFTMRWCDMVHEYAVILNAIRMIIMAIRLEL
jgi:hypothetical protein